MRRVLLPLCALALLTSGCAENAFSIAKKQDTISSYRAFLRDYPKDDNAEAATERLAQLEFEHAQSLHTVLGYKRYLEEFPESRHASTARTLLEGLRFESAKEDGSAVALRLFLREHPDGPHHAEAETLLQAADLKELAKLDDSKSLAQQAQLAAPGPLKDAAEAKLDDVAFTEAKAVGAEKLYQYLTDFPAGAHREEVKRELLSRQLEGLLFSGLVAKAKEVSQRSPLSSQLPDLRARIARAEQDFAAVHAKDQLAQEAQAGNYLRPLEDLEHSLTASDSLERWQAAEELGQVVSIQAIDPLLRAFRDARNPLIREHAFGSLQAVIHALPHAVADYELATRLEALKAVDASPETARVGAVLLDLSGRLSRAAVEYQKAYDPSSPDPAILWRWAHLREERHEPFSAGVAARQLAVWARGVAEQNVADPSANPTSNPASAMPVSVARDLCAAALNAREAVEILHRVSHQHTDFPDDLAEFVREAEAARKLADARLADAELVLRTQNSNAAVCSDARVSERLRAGLQDRRDALAQVPRKLPRLAAVLLRVAAEKDPSPDIRAQAQALLASTPALKAASKEAEADAFLR